MPLNKETKPFAAWYKKTKKKKNKPIFSTFIKNKSTHNSKTFDPP